MSISPSRLSSPLGALALAASSLLPAVAWAAPEAPAPETPAPEAPATESAPPDAPVGAADAPPPGAEAPAAEAAPLAAATSGPRALAGVSWIRVDALGVRLDLGWQFPWTDTIALRGYVASLYHYESQALPDLGGLGAPPFGELELHELAFLAMAEIDVALVSNAQGRLGMGGALGIGPSMAWVKMPDMPFTPGEWIHASAALGRLSGHIEYRFGSGWVVRGQPIGFLFSGHENTDLAFEFSAMGGYQW